VNTRRFSAKNRHTILYSSIDSAFKPVSRDDSVPVRVPQDDGLPTVVHDEEHSQCASGYNLESYDPDYVAAEDIQKL